MKKESKVQYTLRGISEQTDRRLREKAAQYGKSLNETALEALSAGLGLEAQAPVHHDLDDLIGSWVQDEAYDQAMESMDQVDEGLWS